METAVDGCAFRDERRAAAEDEAWESFFPPTDPVLIDNEILGGFSRSSMEFLDVDPSGFDGVVGDEALADAVLLQLKEDAATAGLPIVVEVKNRVAYLRGAVPDIEDAINAQEVAGRIGPLHDVVDRLQVMFPEA
jgi:osmotically-inducible protein OsmY